MIQQGQKYAHKGRPVIALESGSPQSMVKVLPVPRDTYESAYYVLASELVPLGMAYFGGAIPVANAKVSREPCNGESAAPIG